MSRFSEEDLIWLSKVRRLWQLLKANVNEADALNAFILLTEFIAVYRLKAEHDNTGGWWKKLGIKIVGIPIVVRGYLRDIHVNHTVGKALFGNYAKFGTLTATLKRVKKGEPLMSPKSRMAHQICEILNYYAPGHC